MFTVYTRPTGHDFILLFSIQTYQLFRVMNTRDTTRIIFSGDTTSMGHFTIVCSVRPHCFSHVNHVVVMRTGPHLHEKDRIFVSTQGHLQPRFYLKARSLNTTVSYLGSWSAGFANKQLAVRNSCSREKSLVLSPRVPGANCQLPL